jgi:O-antigen ligase
MTIGKDRFITNSRYPALFNRVLSGLAAIEFWAVALAVAASMLNARLAGPALGAASFFWVVRGLRGVSRRVENTRRVEYTRRVENTRRVAITRRTPVDGAVVALLGCLLVTLWASAFPQLTRPQAARLLEGAALFYAAVNWASTPARLRSLAYAVVLSGAGLALMAPFSVNWARDKVAFIPEGIYQRFTVLVADSVHPNVLAGSLVILLPVSLGLLWFSGKRLGWLNRAWIGLAALGMAAILMLTESRSAWAALLAAGVLMAALRWRRGWLLLPLAAAAGAALLAHVGAAHLLDLLASSDLVSGLDGRLEIWSRAVYMIQDFPFTGIGLGSFGPVADRLYPFFSYAPNTILHAHNLFLQVAVDLGMPGLIAWLAIVGTVSTSAWQLYRRGQQVQDGWAAGLGAGLLGSQVALIVHGLFDAVTWGMVRPAPLVWLIWGLALAGWMMAKRANVGTLERSKVGASRTLRGATTSVVR